MSEMILKNQDDKKVSLGFWIYLMTDSVIFASLFATYIVLKDNTAHGPTADELFELPFVFVQTMILLVSSFTAGLALIAVKFKQARLLLFWLGMTFFLGLGFLLLEVFEFSKLYSEGNSWQRSGFLSGYFTLVGAHGLHIFVGLLWSSIILAQIYYKGLTNLIAKRLVLFSLFWHFLDIIWIFIFTFVYLMKGIQL